MVFLSFLERMCSTALCEVPSCANELRRPLLTSTGIGKTFITFWALVCFLYIGPLQKTARSPKKEQSQQNLWIMLGGCLSALGLLLRNMFLCRRQTWPQHTFKKRDTWRKSWPNTATAIFSLTKWRHKKYVKRLKDPRSKVYFLRPTQTRFSQVNNDYSRYMYGFDTRGHDSQCCRIDKAHKIAWPYSVAESYIFDPCGQVSIIWNPEVRSF